MPRPLIFGGEKEVEVGSTGAENRDDLRDKETGTSPEKGREDK